MNKGFIRIIGLSLVLALASVSAMATTTAAMLHGAGGVSVNGSAVMQTSTVFSGDTIETAPNSSASLSMSGSSVLVTEKSSLVFNGRDVSFASGGGIVKTAQGFSARFWQVNVSPAKSTARFQLLQKGNVLNVAALEGDVSILNGNKSIALQAGQSVDIPLVEQEQKGRKRAGAAQDSNQGGGVGSANSSTATGAPEPPQGGGTAGSAWDVNKGVIAGSISVSAVAITGILLVTHKPISPSGP
jgi:hypothetical protein